MKKLIVTAIAAAVAVGTYADAFTQLRFKDASIGSKTIAQLNALAGETAVYWSGDELTNTYTVSAASLGTCPATIDTTPANGLDIKTTFGKPLAVNAVDGGAATNINTGIYFDSLVKFTVCDTDPQQDYNGAKIVMWLQEFENGNTTTTNLMVKAGDLSWNGRAVVSTGAVYKCGNTIDGAFADSWHRVTIKAIANITTDQDIAVPGFAIYIDGSGANCTFIANTSTAKWDSTFTEQFTLNYVAGELNNSNALFPSIDQTTDNKTAVLGASFDGTGSITDLVFTDVAPAFAADPEPPVAPKAAVVINDVPQTGIVTLADAVSAANGASAGSVVISLLENTEIGETLAFASAANVTLDFAGFVITNTAATAAISNAGNLTITNSVGNGGVACTGEGLALDATAGTTTITAGSFWGDLQAAVEGATLLLTGGSYQQDAWTLGGYLDDGKELQANSETGLNDVVDASVEPTTYTVTFDANGGTPVPESQTIDAGGMVVPPYHMTKADYIFNGWTLNGAAYDLDTAVTGDITLVASWTLGVASINGTAYASFKEAVEAATAGQTVKVLQNCTESGMVTITAGITISNDYTVALTGMYALRFANGNAPVTICGTGTLAGSGEGSPLLIGSNETTKDAKYGITTTYEGSVILNGNTITYSGSGNVIKVEYGTFTMNSGTVTAGGNRGVKADADVGNFTSTVIINGGTITSTKAAVAASADTGTAVATINGGNLTGPLTCGQKAGTATLTIPGTSTAKFSADQTAFCATGYETKLVDGWYVVSKIVVDPATGKVAADTAEEAAAAEVVVVPAVAEALETAGVPEATYQTYFTKSTPVLNEKTGKYEVTVSIAEAVETKVEADALAVLSEKEGAEVKVPAGLYYKVETVTEVGATDKNPKTGLSTGAPITGLSKPEGNKGFFKIKIGTQSFE